MTLIREHNTVLTEEGSCFINLCFAVVTASHSTHCHLLDVIPAAIHHVPCQNSIVIATEISGAKWSPPCCVALI
jgi:hypothetical protein